MVPKSTGDKVISPAKPDHTPHFKVGDELVCCDGSTTNVIEVKGEVIFCDDGFYRYDRDYPLERGRVTGSHSWPPHPKTIAEFHPLRHPMEVIQALACCPTFTRTFCYSGGEKTYDADQLMRQVCENLDKLIHFKLTEEVL